MCGDELYGGKGSPRLTYEEFCAGAPCPACGRSWEGDGADNAAFLTQHQGGGRHGLEGSEMVHCIMCCPPPPLSPQKIEQLAALLRK